MPRPSSVVLALAAAVAAGCASGPSPLPLTDLPPPVPTSSSVFAGHARAFRWVNEAWVADPAYDYDFLVLEKRFGDRWEAVKEIYRRHPKYDGRAGPRVQTLWFAVTMSPAPESGHDLVATTSEGNGTGHEKAGGGGLSLEIAFARTNLFVPFDTIRIRQDQTSSPGKLTETVTLLKKGKGGERLFMKMEEEGLVYLPADPTSGAATPEAANADMPDDDARNGRPVAAGLSRAARAARPSGSRPRESASSAAGGPRIHAGW